MFLKKLTYRPYIILLTAVSLILITASQAFAHTRVEIGDYALIVGWVEEPVIVGERNALLVEVHRLAEEDGEELPVAGVESTLDLELIYAGQTFRANLNPTDQAGVYHAEVYPTVRGQYTVRLFGSIEETAVDEIVEPEEVSSAARIQFPEVEPDPFTLQARIDALETSQRNAQLIAYAGIFIGLLGTVLGVIGLRKRSS